MTGPVRRFEELDGLRGIAAIWVVVFHLTFGIQYLWLQGQPALVAEIAPFTLNLQGGEAVSLFFVISGFVIRMTVERCATPRDFLVSRFARLFPVYWVAVTIATTVGLLLPSPRLPVTIGLGISNLTMLQYYFGIRMVDPSYWSLGVELAFYGMMTVILLTKQTNHIDRLGLMWVLGSFALIHIPPAIGFVVPWKISAGLATSYAGLFYAGIMFYRIRTDGFTWSRGAAIVLCLILQIAFESPLIAAIECAIFAVFALSVGDKARMLTARPLVALGTISYSLYVIHQPLGFRLQLGFHALGASPWINLVATIASLIAVATCLTYTIERPAGRFLRRLLTQRPAPATRHFTSASIPVTNGS